MEQGIALRDGRRVFVRSSLEPGDVGRIITFHGEVYSREHGLGQKFEGYVGRTVGKFGETYDPQGDRQRIWLASPPGSRELAGCCAVLDCADEGAQFRWFLVSPVYRSAGLGRLLLEQALDFTRQAGYACIFLYTADFLPPAGMLYRSLGFSLVEEIPFDGWEVPFTQQKYQLLVT